MPMPVLILDSSPSSAYHLAMPNPRAFIAFDYDHDEFLRVALVGQSKHPDTDFAIADWSVKVPFVGDWKDKVRDRIRRVDQVIVICGENTHKATGVAAELEIARAEKKPYFLLKGYPDKTCYKPTTALTTDEIYTWSWENLKNLVRGAR
jgi:hypothetical protein